MRIDDSLNSYELDYDKESARYRQIIAKSQLSTKHSVITIAVCVCTLATALFINMFKTKN